MSESDFLPGLRADSSGSPADVDVSSRGREASAGGGSARRRSGSSGPSRASRRAKSTTCSGWPRRGSGRGGTARSSGSAATSSGANPASATPGPCYGIALAHLDDPAAAVAFLHKAPEHPAVHLGTGDGAGAARAVHRGGAGGAPGPGDGPGFPGALRAPGHDPLTPAPTRRGARGVRQGTEARSRRRRRPGSRSRQVAARPGAPDAWPEVDWRLKVAAFPRVPPFRPRLGRLLGRGQDAPADRRAARRRPVPVRPLRLNVEAPAPASCSPAPPRWPPSCRGPRGSTGSSPTPRRSTNRWTPTPT